MDVLTVVQTRDYALGVDTVRFVWEVLPDQVFYPDSFGGPAGTTDSAVFTIPFLWFPPAVRVHYRVDGGPTRSDTIDGIVQDSWYVLPAGGGREPLVRFGRVHGVEEGTGGEVAQVRCRPNPFSTSVTLQGPGPAAVYDGAGRLVRALPGDGAVVWDGRDSRGRPVRPGVYLFRLGSARVRLVKL
jgi:hypothetical protein